PWFPTEFVSSRPLNPCDVIHAIAFPATAALHLTGRFGIITLPARGKTRAIAGRVPRLDSNRKGHTMISRRTSVVALATGILLATGLPALAKSRRILCSGIRHTDHDG